MSPRHCVTPSTLSSSAVRCLQVAGRQTPDTSGGDVLCAGLVSHLRTSDWNRNLEGDGGMAESPLVISEVRVTLREDEGHDRLKAFATMTLNGAFVVRGLKIIDGPAGLFVAMPSRKRPDGQF